jgi:hypothetical protein
MGPDGPQLISLAWLEHSPWPFPPLSYPQRLSHRAPRRPRHGQPVLPARAGLSAQQLSLPLSFYRAVASLPPRCSVPLLIGSPRSFRSCRSHRLASALKAFSPVCRAHRFSAHLCGLSELSAQQSMLRRVQSLAGARARHLRVALVAHLFSARKPRGVLESVSVHPLASVTGPPLTSRRPLACHSKRIREVPPFSLFK